MWSRRWRSLDIWARTRTDQPWKRERPPPIEGCFVIVATVSSRYRHSRPTPSTTDHQRRFFWPMDDHYKSVILKPRRELLRKKSGREAESKKERKDRQCSLGGRDLLRMLWGWIFDYLWCLPICLLSSLCWTWGTYSFILILFYHFNIITIIYLGRSIRIYIFSGGTRRGLVLSTVPMCKMWKTRPRLKHFWSNYSPMQPMPS